MAAYVKASFREENARTAGPCLQAVGQEKPCAGRSHCGKAGPSWHSLLGVYFECRTRLAATRRATLFPFGIVHDHEPRAAIAPHAQQNPFIFDFAAQFDRFLGVSNRFPINLQNHVARSQPGTVCF
jgi:hypothetical protein